MSREGESVVLSHLGSDLEEGSISDWISLVVDLGASVWPPGGVSSALALVPLNVVVHDVSSGVGDQAKSSKILDVVSLSAVGKDLLEHNVVVALNASNSGPLRVPVVTLHGDSIVSLVERSNGSSSSVEGEPLSLVFWVEVLDSKVSTSGVDGLSSLQLRSDLELNTILEWLSWVDVLSLVSVPSLVQTVVAVVVLNPSVMSVLVSIDVEASTTIVSDSSSTFEPSRLVFSLSSEWSNDSMVVDFVSITGSV